MKRKVYVESTIPSYLVAAPSRDLLIAAHQHVTSEWWRTQSAAFDLFISQWEALVAKDPIIDEIRKNRQEIAEQFGYDLRAIVADARKRQKAGGKTVVSFTRGKKTRTA